jgi:hypothetical protein
MTTPPLDLTAECEKLHAELLEWRNMARQAKVQRDDWNKIADDRKAECERLKSHNAALLEACEAAERAFRVPAGTSPTREVEALDKLRSAIALEKGEK